MRICTFGFRIIEAFNSMKSFTLTFSCLMDVYFSHASSGYDKYESSLWMNLKQLVLTNGQWRRHRHFQSSFFFRCCFCSREKRERPSDMQHQRSQRKCNWGDGRERKSMTRRRVPTDWNSNERKLTHVFLVCFSFIRETGMDGVGGDLSAQSSNSMAKSHMR